MASNYSHMHMAYWNSGQAIVGKMWFNQRYTVYSRFHVIYKKKCFCCKLIMNNNVNFQQTNYEFGTWVMLETICHAECDAVCTLGFNKLRLTLPTQRHVWYFTCSNFVSSSSRVWTMTQILWENALIKKTFFYISFQETESEKNVKEETKWEGIE